MAENILNIEDLDNYIKDVVYRGQDMEIFSSGNFNSVEFVQQHKDEIVRSMLFQWTKYTLKPYMSTKTPQTMRFLPLVNVVDGDLPTWVRNCMDKGESVYRFKADRISDSTKDKIIMVRDFMYSVGESYVNKIIARAKDTQKKYEKNPNAKGNKNQEKPRIRIDYLKTNSEYDSFNKVLKLAQKWHENIAIGSKFKKYDAELYEESLKGTKPAMDLADGMYVVQLTTPEALDFESEYMGHCVGKGIYDEELKNKTVKIYSLRDENGEPHATFEVRGKRIEQCKGKQDKAPVAKYRPYVQEFVIRKKLEIDGDAKNIGLIKCSGKYYDLYNLPKDKKLVLNGNLDVSDMGFEKLPDFSNLVVKGGFYCHGNKLSDLYGSPAQVLGDYDVSENNLKDLRGIVSHVKDLDISGNPIEKLDNLPIIGRNLTAVNIEIENMSDVPTDIKGDVLVSNKQNTLFMVKQDGKYYNLFEQPDGFVYNGDIYIPHGTKELPNLSHIVLNGSFECSGNKITSLNGSPKCVTGYFSVCDTLITSLEGMPEKIGENVDLVSNHRLKSLKGIAQSIEGNLNLSDCPELKEFDALPQEISGKIICGDELVKKYHLSEWGVSLDEVKAAVAYNVATRNDTRER